MNMIPYIPASKVEHRLTYKAISDAMIDGHRLNRANIDDILFKEGSDALLSRAAWIKGFGLGVKTATLFPENANLSPPLATINSVFSLFDPQTGLPLAIIDGNMVTKWKTASDSILGARLLARPNSKTLLIIGAGTVARSLIEAYSELFPKLDEILIWNRTYSKAQELAKPIKGVRAVDDLATAAAQADIISSATMSIAPVLKGAWVSPGCHVDLIGAYSPEMREADDDLIKKAELFVDARETTIHDIGELIIPLKNGVITEQDVRADLYDLCNGAKGRSSDQAITLYKNGGGAHLDLMTATHIYKTFQA